MKTHFYATLFVAVTLLLTSYGQILDDVVLFEKQAPFLLQNITWYDCPLYSASPSPIYENLTQYTTEEEYHKMVFQEMMKQRHPLGAPIPDFKLLKEAEALGIRMAECSVVGLPVDFDNQNSPKIHVFVKRLRQSRSRVAKNSLWLLQGGPGGSYTAFEKVMPVLSKQIEDFDLYTLDHRGVGYSSRLGCPSSQAETTGSEGGVAITDDELYLCGKELLNSGYQNKFTPTGAAWDLASLVASTNKLYGYNTYIYGVSYGTMWLSRFLQVSIANEWNTDKTMYKGIILDGVVSTSSGDATHPDTSKRLQLSQWDVNMNDVGLYLMETYCNNATICYDKLAVKTKTTTKEPVQVLREVFESVYVNGTCQKFSSVVSEETLRVVLGSFLMDLHLREFIPAIIYRLKRCDPDVDIPTLLHLSNVMTAMSNQTETCPPLSSLVLQLNIMFAEIWPRDLQLATYDRLYGLFNTTYMATGAYMTAKSLEVSHFPIYTPDQYFNKAPQPDVPTLLLNGDLDPQTTLLSAQNQLSNMGAKNTRLITVTYAPHATVFRSPETNSSIPCGMQMMVSFLQHNDLTKIDTSCLQRLEKVHFNGTDTLNNLYFGVSDIYEDAYQAPEVEKKVNLYLFIGVEAGTVVLSIIVICCLIYYIVQLKDKNSSEYEEIEN